MLRHGSLFSGIGGFDLAAEWMGWENVFHCEYDPFCQKVLNHHFPNSKLYEDIKTFDASNYLGRIDILSGGFPCQPFSQAGLRRGAEDDRHLWPQMLRIIREVFPRYVVGENVRGLINWSGGLVFEQVCADLENEGYEVTPYLLPACGKNAPHRRDRIWFIAKRNDPDTDIGGLEGTNKERRYGFNVEWEGEFGDAPDTDNNGRSEKRRYDRSSENVKGGKQKSIGAADTKNSIGCGADGISERQTESNGTTCKKELRKENPTTTTIGDSGMVTKQNYREEISERDTSKDDNGRALVQEEQVGVQLPKCGRMEFDSASIKPLKGYDTSDDIPRKKELDGDTPDTFGLRLEERTKSFGKPRGWEEFPTQPPLCGGDDGIPQELDGITFPKWRKESIKAYGNAIVPQVAHEIFKAIQKMEDTFVP
tara:strand:+ start:21 stop:1289 length:1269 start_codon:yes stop_codon:yes gene_type:complete